MTNPPTTIKDAQPPSSPPSCLLLVSPVTSSPGGPGRQLSLQRSRNARTACPGGGSSPSGGSTNPPGSALPWRTPASTSPLSRPPGETAATPCLAGTRYDERQSHVKPVRYARTWAQGDTPLVSPRPLSSVRDVFVLTISGDTVTVRAEAAGSGVALAMDHDTLENRRGFSRAPHLRTPPKDPPFLPKLHQHVKGSDR